MLRSRSMSGKRKDEKKKTTHPAHPAQGPVDYKALAKEIIERFPKVLARLAE